ncbi:hypothetical protein [Methylomonas sp. TEB]|uniref:hypothetical protein n=1 Tax=Methylomonas sp. TEB TaxID=3398229 RepID=UPI0039F55634
MSMLHYVTNEVSDDLLRALRNAIENSIHNGKDEPSIVAQLTYEIPKAVNRLRLNVGGYNLTAGGVFIHQTPKVSFSGIIKQKSIELGDVLFVSTITDGIDESKMALLYQAKMFESFPVEPDNNNQHKLYEKWPKFEYVRSGIALNGEKRKIRGSDLHSATKYLLIRKSNSRLKLPYYLAHWLSDETLAITAQPTYPLSNHECFIKEIFHFLLGDAGKEFVNAACNEIGWNRVVNDLLNETAKKLTSYMRKASTNSKPAIAPRGFGCLHYGHSLSIQSDILVSNEVYLSDDDNFPPKDIPPKSENNNEEDGGGISVIEFVWRLDERLKALNK